VDNVRFSPKNEEFTRETCRGALKKRQVHPSPPLKHTRYQCSVSFLVRFASWKVGVWWFFTKWNHHHIVNYSSEC